MRWERLVEILQKNSPHDYEKYLSLLYNFEESEYIRKIKALKFVLNRIIKLRLYADGKMPKRDESRCGQRKNNREYLSMLLKYDVISFDLFDTLVIRTVMYYADIYNLVGIKLGVYGFANTLINEEKEAIQRKADCGLGEAVDLFDIYSIIQEWCDIDLDMGVSTEIAVEMALCNINPYWSGIIRQLVDLGKNVIIVSDSPLHSKEIRQLLNKTGFEWKGLIFVSCECGMTKRSRILYDHIKKLLGDQKKYVHVGANNISDVQAPKKCRWDSIYYEDVHEIGRPYRRIGKSIIVESIAGGIIDTSLHNGVQELSRLEEFGFNYFGRLYVGYCQWLNSLAKTENIDKFLFVARDGYLIRKIYRERFGNIPAEYVYVSRYALSQIVAVENMEFYIRQNLLPKAMQGNATIEEVFTQLQIEELISGLELVGIKHNSLLCRKNLHAIRLFLYKNRNRIAKIFEVQCRAAEKYFEQYLDDCNKICVVDVGWHGSCIMGIIDFIKKHMGWGGEVIGAQVGLECDDLNIGFNAADQIHVYAFSPTYNVELYKQHDFGFINVIDEIAFSAPEPSLLQYNLSDQGDIELIFNEEPKENMDIVRGIHCGVMKYVEKFYRISDELGLELPIPAQVAYEPIVKVVKKREYINKLLHGYKVQRNCDTREDSWKDVTHV